MTLLAGLFASALLGLSGQPAPETDPSGQDATTVEGVVITGRPLRRIVEDFVDEVVEPPPGRGPARWYDRATVCTGVVNLRRDAAQALADRVSRVALDLGLDIGEPGCRPNVLIIATDDGPGLAAALVDSRPRAFQPRHAGAARSQAALERFRTSDQAVRWWHISALATDTGSLASGIVPGGTYLTSRIRNNLLRAFIIVDLSRTDAVSFQQLSDYVAMVAFAQINPDAELSRFPSVLNTFHDPSVADGLTDWDMSYLSALYGVELNQRHPDSQGGAVSWAMFRDQDRARSGQEDERDSSEDDGQ